VELRGLEPLTSSMPSTVDVCGGPALREGSTRVKSGVWVPLSGEYRFGFNQVVAVRLSGGSVATFATKNLGKANHGLLIAINGTARKHFAWAQT
jgi:hypothetical protein